MISIDTLQKGFPNGKSTYERDAQISLVSKDQNYNEHTPKQISFKKILSVNKNMQLLKYSFTACWSVHW